MTGVAKQIAAILTRHGVPTDSDKGLRVLDDFYGRFHDDILNYQSTVIAELLNNVRWGIHDYLMPEYLRAKVPDSLDPIKYSFKFPEGISHEFGRFCYEALMNSVRRKPCMERFVANRTFKTRY